jgi:hypothetical protein
MSEPGSLVWVLFCNARYSGPAGRAVATGRPARVLPRCCSRVSGPLPLWPRQACTRIKLVRSETRARRCSPYEERGIGKLLARYLQCRHMSRHASPLRSAAQQARLPIHCRPMARPGNRRGKRPRTTRSHCRACRADPTHWAASNQPCGFHSA